MSEDQICSPLHPATVWIIQLCAVLYEKNNLWSSKLLYSPLISSHLSDKTNLVFSSLFSSLLFSKFLFFSLCLFSNDMLSSVNIFNTIKKHNQLFNWKMHFMFIDFLYIFFTTLLTLHRSWLHLLSVIADTYSSPQFKVSV